jgi:hypothetical protein
LTIPIRNLFLERLDPAISEVIVHSIQHPKNRCNRNVVPTGATFYNVIPEGIEKKGVFPAVAGAAAG